MIDTLINKNNPLDENYVPEDLVVTDNNEGNFHKYVDPSLKPSVTREVYEAFCSLQEDAKKDGINIIIDSGYRSYDYQSMVFDSICEEKGVDYAFEYVAIPGTSEHQSGLAIDIAVLNDGVYDDNITEESDVYKWMIQNAHYYGFILRYPKGKESITGYNFEPWHYRYVGVSLAINLYEQGITLEEHHLKNSLTLKMGKEQA